MDAGALNITGDTCTLLQLTDFHWDQDEAANLKTQAMVSDMIARVQPHALVLTGDIWCGDEMVEAVPRLQHEVLGWIDSFQIPWTTTFGNHDYIGSMEATWAMLQNYLHCIPAQADEQGNFRIQLLHNNTPAWDLFFIHSGERWELPQAMDWFKDESTQCELPAIAFFHLPMGNYLKAQEAGNFIGVGEEKVMCWGDEENRAAAILKASKTVRAAFCGHNHECDFYFEEDGVRFVFGRSTGHGGYGEHPAKGATVITVDMNSDRVTHMHLEGV